MLGMLVKVLYKNRTCRMEGEGKKGEREGGRGTIAVNALRSWKFDIFHNAEMQEYKDEALSFISSVSVGNSHQDQAAQPPLIPFTEVFKFT